MNAVWRKYEKAQRVGRSPEGWPGREMTVSSRGMPRSARLWLAACAFAAAGAWLALGFAREVYRTLDLETLRPPPVLPPVVWRYSTPQAQRLRAFLERVGERVPAGSRVAFASRPTRADGEFYRFLWASYWLPGLVVMPETAAAGREVDYWIAFGRTLDRADLELLLTDEAGSLHRAAGSQEH